MEFIGSETTTLPDICGGKIEVKGKRNIVRFKFVKRQAGNKTVAHETFYSSNAATKGTAIGRGKVKMTGGAFAENNPEIISRIFGKGIKLFNGNELNEITGVVRRGRSRHENQSPPWRRESKEREEGGTNWSLDCSNMGAVKV